MRFIVTLDGAHFETEQTDITQQGYLFSAVVIFLGNAGVLLLAIPLLAARVTVWVALGWWVGGTVEVLRGMGRML